MTNISNSNEKKQPCLSYSVTFSGAKSYGYSKNQPSIAWQIKIMNEIAFMKNMSVLESYSDEDVQDDIPVESLPGFQKALLHFETSNYPNLMLMVDDISRVSRNKYRQYLLLKRATAVCGCSNIYSGTYFLEELGFYKPDFLTKATKMYEALPSSMIPDVIAPHNMMPPHYRQELTVN